MALNKAAINADKVKNEKEISSLFIYLFIATAGIAVFFLYLFFVAKNPHSAIKPVNLFFTAADRYMDFFNLLFASDKLNAYAKYPSASSPVFYIICFVINKLAPSIVENRFGVRDVFMEKLVFDLYIAVSLFFFIAAFNTLFNKFKVKILKRFWFYLVFLLSYPVIFAIDRGNYALMTGGIIAIFLVNYMDGRTMLAAVILGMAAALKYYYAFFFILFLIDRKYIGFLVSAATAAIILTASLAVFDKGLFVNANAVIRNLTNYNLAGGSMQTAEALGHNTSIYMLVDIPYVISNKLFLQRGDALAATHAIMSRVSILVLLLVAGLSAGTRNLHDKFMLFIIGILLYPFLSFEYIIPVIFFPLAYWMLNEPKDRVMPVLGALYIICKRYYSFYDMGGYISVTIQGILNPLILLLMILYLIWLRRREFPGVYSEKAAYFAGLMKRFSEMAGEGIKNARRYF